MALFSRWQTYPREARGATGHLEVRHSPMPAPHLTRPCTAGDVSFPELGPHLPSLTAEHSVEGDRGIPSATISPINAQFCHIPSVWGRGAGQAEEEQLCYSSAWAFRHRRTTLAPTPGNRGKIKIPALPYHTSTWQPCPTRRTELESTGKALPGRGDR